MNIQPKPYLDNFKLRHQSYGKERRLNMSKLILDHGTPFPKGVELDDIDNAMKEWVENELALSYDGKKLPTFRLFSNQRLSEYSQTWNHLDEVGNLLMNFKTLTRDNNPRRGENQGQYYNIPGNRDYPMFIVPVLQENGLESYDIYSMKQPFCLDIEYNINIITNKYELLNKMVQMVNEKFKSINCYIFPNNHPMPMTLEDISDESEYSIDDMKYFSQGYKIKIKAYIIREEDFKVTRVESRVKVRLLTSNEKTKKRTKVSLEEEMRENNPCYSELYDRYYYKGLTVVVEFPNCDKEVEFTLDSDMVIESVTMDNVYDAKIRVNCELIDFEDLDRLYEGDTINIKISSKDEFKSSFVTLHGYDPNTVVDIENADKESQLDSQVTDEEIFINKGK